MQPTINRDQLKNYLNASIAWAQKIGNIAIGGFRASQARRKTDGTLVTLMDEKVDRMLTEFILEAFPEHAILSEEGNTLYVPDNHFTWVVDPIDGTTNFARGLPIWGVSIALLWFGIPMVGVVNFPSLHEFYHAAFGMGAFCNNNPIRSASVGRESSQQLFLQCSRSAKHYKLKTRLKSRTLGSAAYHLVKVADGTAVASLEVTPKLWDIAAPCVIVQEAGAVITQVDGKPVFPLPHEPMDYDNRSIACLTAASLELHKHLLHKLSPEPKT